MPFLFFPTLTFKKQDHKKILMPSVCIRLFANLREIVKKSEVEITVQGKISFHEILNKLFEAYPRLRQDIMDGATIKQHYRFFLNGLQVDQSKMDVLEVPPNSTIVILPPAGGG